jgi:hypothetical protein
MAMTIVLRLTRARTELSFTMDRPTTTMKTLAALAALLLTMVPAQAQTKPTLTGKWTGTMTRTAPDGASQTIPWMLDLTQKGTVLTGTAGPNAERQWPIEKDGAVNGSKVTFKVQQPDGAKPLRTFTLTLVKDRLQGEMLAEAQGQSFTTKVDLGRAPAK